MPNMRTTNTQRIRRLGETLLILGNGSRYQLDKGNPELTITFNRPVHLEITGKQVDVHMTRDADGTHRLSVSSGHHAGLTGHQHVLNLLLDQQALALGCLPSTGYALIHGLWHNQASVVVDGIWFNPSLARPSELAPRKSMPQAFHNWLGERRTTFQRWLTEPPVEWCWPMIDGADTKSSPAHTAKPQGSILHRQLMEIMVESAKSRSMRLLADIAQVRVTPSPDLLHASPEMTQLEQMFHLSRTQSDTPNWWLFDARASVLIEQIAQHLRLAQYLAFSHTASKKVGAE